MNAMNSPHPFEGRKPPQTHTPSAQLLHVAHFREYQNEVTDFERTNMFEDFFIETPPLHSEECEKEMLNMKRSLLEMHPKYEAMPGKHPTLIEPANTPVVPDSHQVKKTQNPFLFGMQFGMQQFAHLEPVFRVNLGLFQPQLSESQSAISRRENEKEQIRHSAEWISKKETHLCR